MIALSYVLAQTIIFQLYAQSGKRLRENGISELAILSFQRYALYPALVMLILSYDRESVVYLIEHPFAIIKFMIFLLASGIFMWVYFASLHVARSLSFVKALRNAIGLPILMISGYYINGDIPTVGNAIAILLLVIALFIGVENANSRENISEKPYSLKWAILIMLAFIVLQNIKDPLYRDFVTHIPSLLFWVALSMTVLMAGMNLFFSWKKPDTKKPANISRVHYLISSMSIPVLYFLGTIPEAFSFKSFPVYVMISLMAISFLMSLISDFLNHRICFTSRTVIFIFLILSSISINVYAYIV
jgi:hypothetical protein